MNERNPRRKLLEDVLMGESFEPFDSMVRARALKAFERRHRLRRMRPILVISTVTILSVIFAFTRFSPKNKPDGSVVASGAPKTRGRDPFLISDAKLLSYFPPNSCSLVETDGKSILVFWDPELRRRVFQEADAKGRLKPGG